MKDLEFIFNEYNCKTFNVIVSSYPSIPFQNEEYDECKVEGMNGTLHINKGTYPDLNLKFKLKLISYNYMQDIIKIRTWLNNIHDDRLIYGFKDKCFRVKKVILNDITKELKICGSFTVEFICKSFLEDVEQIEIEVKNNSIIYYDGTVEGDSIIKIYGNGNIQIAINNEAMTIKNIGGYVEIDSELKQVRNADGTSKDMDTLGDFPMLQNGENTINYSGNISKVEIEYKNKYL